MARKLSPKMRSFIDCYFGDANFNASKAYRMSDYDSNGNNSGVRSREVMAIPIVKQEIERRLNERTEMIEKKAVLEAEYLIKKLAEIIEAEQEKNPNAALRAIELAGKSIALWKDRQEISGPDGEAIKHEQHVKESVADLNTKLESLTRRATGTDDSSGASNVVGFPNRRAES